MDGNSGAQVLLPANSEEQEDFVFDRFVEGSREIAPNLQVTLAKRFMQPGSNKILCLAARTSVPLTEDQVASVSNLALRLSDGTNVVLSVRLFNEESPPAFTQTAYEAGYSGPRRTAFTPCSEPIRASYYEPSRYTFDSESKLGIFLAVSAVLSVLAFYLVASNAGNSGISLSQMFHSIASQPQAEPPAEKTRGNSTKVQKTSNAHSKPKPAARPHRSTRARASSKTSSSSHRSSMFVPPPPPVMVFDAPPEAFWGYSVPPAVQKTLPAATPKSLPHMVPIVEPPTVPKNGNKAAPKVEPHAVPKAEVAPKTELHAIPKVEPAPKAELHAIPKPVPKTTSEHRVEPSFAKQMPEPAYGPLRGPASPRQSNEGQGQFAPVVIDKPAPLPGADPNF